MKGSKILSKLNRPFVKASLSVVFGICIFSILGKSFFFLILPFIFYSLILRRWKICLLCFLAFLSALNYGIAKKRPKGIELFYKKCVVVDGVVLQRPRKLKEYSFFKIRSKKILYHRIPYTLKADIGCMSKECLSLFTGDEVKIKAPLYRPKKKGDIDALMYICKQDLLFVKESKNPIFFLAKILRKKMSEGIKTLSHPHDKLLSSMLLWEKDGLPHSIEEAFRKSGTAHIFAVSGLHVGLIVAFLYTFIVCFLRLKREVFTVFCLFFIPLYVIIVGAPPSAIRAAVMCLFTLFSTLLDRDIEPFNALFGALFFILFFDPLIINSVSLWLSFSATFGIIFAFFLFLKNGKMSYFKSLLLSSIFAYLFTFPICGYYFGKAAVFGILANIFVVPLASLFLNIGFVFSFLPHFVKELLSPLCIILSKSLLFFVHLFSSLPGCVISLNFPLFLLPIYYAALFLILCFLKVKS